MRVIDFRDPAFRDDPHPQLAELRWESPVARVEGMRAYLVTRHSDCLHLLKSDLLGFENLSRLAHLPESLRGYHEMRRHLMLFQDPPEHPQTRAAGDEVLRDAPDVETLCKESTRRLLNDFSQGGDFIEEVARPYVAEIILKVLRLEGVDIPRITRLAQDLADSLDPLASTNSRERAGERYLELKGHLASACPAHGDLATLVMLVAAGLQTTGHILGLAVRHFLKRGRFFTQTRVIEEFYRYYSPAQMTRRVVKKPFSLHGYDFQTGIVIWLSLASANRDEHVFDDPHQLNVNRSPNRHLAFGAGSHQCIGAKLARVQLRVFLEEFGSVASDWELPDDVPIWNGNLLFKGLAHLHLEKMAEIR